MPATLWIRSDIPAEELPRPARIEANGRVACRLLAIANALDGMSRERAAEQAGIDRQSLRNWVIRFNAEGIPGLQDRPRADRPSFLDDGELAVFRAMVLRGPDVVRDGVSSWTAKDLCRLVEARFGVRYRESGMLKLLHSLGLSEQKARPSHLKADPAAQAVKKTSKA